MTDRQEIWQGETHSSFVPIVVCNFEFVKPRQRTAAIFNKSSAIAEKADRCVASRRADTAFVKYPFPHFKFADYQFPRRSIGVRLSLLSTVKTNLRISHLLENLKTANQKVMMYIFNHCKHLFPLSIEEYLTYTYT